MKKIVIINAHPSEASLNFGLADSYKKGAESAGLQIKEIQISNN